MAHAKFRERMVANGIFIAKAVVHVFDGDPLITGESAIFYSFSDLHSCDLLDELRMLNASVETFLLQLNYRHYKKCAFYLHDFSFS